MSNQLCLVPVGGLQPAAQRPVRLEFTPGEPSAIELWRDGDALVPVADADQLPVSIRRRAQLIAVVYAKFERGSPEWYLIRHSEKLTLSGASPAPLLARLEPGALFAVGDCSWFVTRIWMPVPHAAPPAIAAKACPHCGGPLGLADVVQCLCGRYTHLERPEAADDPDALNCYLQSGTCGQCGRSPALRPRLIPEPPDTFCDEHVSSDEWPWQEQPA